MFWKRATPAGGFWGLLAGTLSSIGMWAWVKLDPTALRYVALSPHAKAMAENMFRALWSCLICVSVTVVVSLLTQPKTGGGTDWAGLRLHRDALGRRPAAVPAAHLLGGDGGRGLRGAEYHFLVGKTCIVLECFRSGFSSASCCWSMAC